MRDKIILLIFGLFALNLGSLNAQKWHFGDFAGLDFGGGAPVNLNGGQTNVQEGVGVQYDCNGDLLFYSDGINIWDGTHAAMAGGPLGGNISNTQLLTCPKPGSGGLVYYIFYGIPGNCCAGATIMYAEIDMSVGANGTVTSKDNAMPTVSGAIFFEGMTMVEHSNGTDFWFVLHRGNSTRFETYSITAAGVAHNGGYNLGQAMAYGSANIGCMATSSLNNRIGYANSSNDRAQVFGFNNATGAVTGLTRNWTFAAADWPYGCDFSPDGNQFFVGNLAGGNMGLWQLNVGTGAASQRTAKRIAGVSLGPDNRVYTSTIWESDLGVITNPNTYPGTFDPTALGGAGFGANVAQDALPRMPLQVPCVPLPIDLLSFSAELNGEVVNLNWTTSAEENNDYFTVERSVSGMDWESIITLPGAGNSSESIFYSAVDDQPVEGASYYRLKQTDYDGESRTFKVESVELARMGELKVLRSSGGEVEFSARVDSDKEVLVEVYNVIGDRLSMEPMILNQGGNRDYRIGFEGMSSGIYFLKVSYADGQVQTLKFRN